MDRYTDFINQIPNDKMQGVDYRLCRDIAIFRPRSYIAGVRMHSSDYHLIVPTVPPPDTYINGRLTRFHGRNVVAFNPGDSIFCQKSSPTTPYITLLIKPDLLRTIAGEMEISSNVHFLHAQNPISNELAQVIRSFERESARGDSLALILDSMGIQITAMMLREFKSNVKKYPSRFPEHHPYVERATEYIQHFYNSNITIEDICREVSLSPFYFIRAFKERTGLSPHQYLIRVRIEKAQELLRTRQYSVSEVGHLCGFINASHFSNTFRVVTGKTPKEFLSGNRIYG